MGSQSSLAPVMQQRPTGSGGTIGMQGIKFSRAIASSFDGLVRSSRAQSAASSQIARRVLDTWMGSPGAGLEIDVRALRVDGEEGLVASENDGRWLLPAFMAGLRVIKPKGDVGAWDVLRLAEELGLLQPNANDLAVFRDWLWSDGAEGFDVELQISFMEVMESAESKVCWEDWSLAAVRSLSGATTGRNSVRIGSKEIDIASLRKPFQMSLMTLQSEAKDGRHTLTGQQIQDLRVGCDLGSSWADVEMDAVLHYPELRNTIPPDRLARRIVSLLSSGCDIRLLQFLTSLAATDDPYSKAVLTNLESQPLGEILARNVVLDGPGTSALAQCLLRAPRHLSCGLMHGILERCASDAELLAPLVRIASQGGVDKMVMVLDPERLNLPQAKVLSRLFSSAGVKGGSGIGLKLAGACRVGVKCALLAGLPSRDLVENSEMVLKLLLEASPEEGGLLLGALAEARDPSSLVLLGQALMQSHGKGWSARSMRVVCEALVATPSGCDALVRLVRSTSTDTEARLACLRALERRPELLLRVSRWTLREALFDPPAVKERLREVRHRDSQEGPS